MISIKTFIDSKIKYIVDHIMPSDLSEDVKEGLKMKEDMIDKVTEESIREDNPRIDETIEFLNSQSIDEDKYKKYLAGDIRQEELFDKPKPATITTRYCIDNVDMMSSVDPSDLAKRELLPYVENNKIKVDLPENADSDGRKHTYVYILNSLHGEMTDTYDVENVSWSLIPGDGNIPEDPNFIKIRFRGIIPGIYGIKVVTDAKECLPTPEDIAAINSISNTMTWTDPTSLVAKATAAGLIKATDWFKVTLWTTILNLIPVSQNKLPERETNIDLKEGDIFNFSPKLPSVSASDIAQNLIQMRCWMYFKKEWIELPYGLRTITYTDSDAFLTWLPIDFNEEHTGGLYCASSRVFCKKFTDITIDNCVYINFTNPQKESKPPQKRCCCKKSSSCKGCSCDKGKTKTAIQFNPAVNKEWFNNMMDLLLHTELDPTLQAIKDLADALKAVVGTSTIWGQVTDSTGFTGMADAVKSACDAIIDRDIAVDMACSLIESPSNYKTNDSIDSAIDDFDSIMEDTICKSVSCCCGGKTPDQMTNKDMQAISKVNSTSDQIIMKLMNEFTKDLNDAASQCGTGESEMEKLEQAIEIAKQKIRIKAEAEAAKIPALYQSIAGN